MVDPQGWGSKPQCRMGLFPDSNALSCAAANLWLGKEISVVKETSYFDSNDKQEAKPCRSRGFSGRGRCPERQGSVDSSL
jgi:hypothetical protein